MKRDTTPRKATPIVLDPSDTIGSAFATVCRASLTHLSHNQAAYLATRDEEALHQVRVAARRLRTALSLTRDQWDGDAKAARLATELKSRAAPFGTARDLDVFLSTTFTVEMASVSPRLVKARKKLVDRQDLAHDEVAAILRTKKWKRLVKATGSWSGSVDWPDPARPTASTILRHQMRRVTRNGADLENLSPVRRHQVRIDAKKLRYGSEFFASLYPERSKDVPDLLVTLSEIQDALGALNDLSTAEHIFASAGVTSPDPSHERSLDLLQDAQEAIYRLRALDPFWTKRER